MTGDADQNLTKVMVVSGDHLIMQVATIGISYPGTQVHAPKCTSRSLL